MKVTFCIYDKPDAVGGPTSWVQRLLPSLRDREIDVRCLFLMHWGESGPALEFLRSQDFPCEVVRAHDRTVDRVEWIVDRICSNQPDIFVPNHVVAGYYATPYLARAGIPTVGILHSDDPYYWAIQDEFVFGASEYRVSALVCVSKEIEQQVLARNPQPTSVRRIPYGVPIPALSAERNEGPFRIGYVGRLTQEQKRIGDVTLALCRATEEIPNVEAVIYGDGPDKELVESILAARPKAKVVSAGAVSANVIQNELRECHAVVLLSDYEGLPISLLEAMACGCVPICRRTRSGIGELIEHEVTGLLVSDNVDSFVAAVRRLHEDRALLAALSANARELIVNDFSTDRSADQWASMLGELQRERRGSVKRPRAIALPSFNPALESADMRNAEPSLVIQSLRRARMIAGRWRRPLGLNRAE
jgi:colanic acid/amylovoran biosynthesis glycosyltransferase